jgi:hypothetical protein
MRTDERSGVFGFGQSRRSHSDVSPCANARGLTVGWTARPSRASEPTDDLVDDDDVDWSRNPDV